MSRHDDNVRLHHMLDHARIALRHGKGKSSADIADDELLSLALVRALEVIGEAANRVSAETRATIPAIPWRDVIDLRNRLVHGYDTVDLDIVEDIIRNDLLPLVRELERILDSTARENDSSRTGPQDKS